MKPIVRPPSVSRVTSHPITPLASVVRRAASHRHRRDPVAEIARAVVAHPSLAAHAPPYFSAPVCVHPPSAPSSNVSASLSASALDALDASAAHARAITVVAFAIVAVASSSAVASRVGWRHARDVIGSRRVLARDWVVEIVSSHVIGSWRLFGAM